MSRRRWADDDAHDIYDDDETWRSGHSDDDAGDDDDRDAPLDSDLDDDASEDDTPTGECPHCRREIAASSPRCPYCGEYVDVDSAPRKQPPWIMAAAILLLAAFAAALMWRM